MPKKRSIKASVNLDAYFAGRYYDDRFLQFLRYDSAPAAANYVLTLPDDKLRQFYEVTMQLKRACDRTMDAAEQQLRLFNRIAEQETNWIVYPLYVVAHQLLSLALHQAASHELLEQCGRTIHRSFNLCLNDRNPEEHENRRTGCYTFANLEFRLYHALRNRDMMKNLVKVLQSRGDELPPLRDTLAAEHKSHCVTYHYYMGEYYGCHEANFVTSFEHLNTALITCPVNSASGKSPCCRQLWHILLLLIPHAMLAHRYYPNWDAVERICTPDVYATLHRYYGPVTACLLDGDVTRYDDHCAQHEVFFLKHGLYVAMGLLRQLVWLKRFHNCWLYGTDRAASVVPLEVFLVGSDQQQDTGAREEQLDALECQLANQISNGNIKGYLSHSKRCIVLSKRDPFPRRCT